MKMAIILVMVSLILSTDSQIPESRSVSVNEAVVMDGMPLENLGCIPAYVPPNENHIHIGGGFFATFNSMSGSIGVAGASAGSIEFNLETLGWESRFVYLPGGTLYIGLNDGTELEFSLQRLEYIPKPSGDESYYRLSSTSEDKAAVLICDVQNAGGSGSPVLTGGLILSHAGGSTETYMFKLGGRDEYAAERHLNRVIYVVSDFSKLS
jgi:hypothetical protein